MLILKNLAAARGDRLLFAGLEYAVGPGQALHLLGANGSGKTTLLRILAGLLSPAAGRVLWHGRPVSGFARGYDGAMAWLGPRNGLKAGLTAQQCLHEAAVFAGRKFDETVCLAALAQLGMREAADVAIERLSQGQQRRVALARVVASGANLWLLDEPANALDDTGLGLLQTAIEGHLSRGGSLVFAQHQPLLPENSSVTTLTLADYRRAMPEEGAAWSPAYVI